MSARRSPRDRVLQLGMLAIWIVALALRLWHLGELEPPVFDEVYFPKFAEAYLDGTAPYDAHPPLGKYLIASGIVALGRNAWGYRIATAIAGSLIPVAVAGLAYKISYRRRFAWWAGGLMLCDGLFLVESRLGLLNTFLVLFGVVAQIYAIAALEARGARRGLLLGGAGLLLGASASVKWNGLGFALALAGMAALAWSHALLRLKSPLPLGIWGQVRSLRWKHYLVYFGFLPAGFYLLQWLPHLLQQGIIQPGSGWRDWVQLGRRLLQLHASLMGLHTSATAGVGVDELVHPYCSTWLSWPVLARPMGYFFQADGNIWRDVHAIGNPVEWWLATAAVVGLAVWGLARLQAIPAYWLVGYAANLLPWALVSRCVFIYHYMSAYVFGILALAWVMDASIGHPKPIWRWLGWSAAIAIVACALFFSPIWLALPLSPEQFYRRIWFVPDRIPGFNWL